MYVEIEAYQDIPDSDKVKVSPYRVDSRMYHVDDPEVIKYMSQYMCTPIRIIEGGNGRFILYNSVKTVTDEALKRIFEPVFADNYDLLWIKNRKVLFHKAV